MFYFGLHSDAYKQALGVQFQDDRQAGYKYDTCRDASFTELWVFAKGCYLYNVVPSGRCFRRPSLVLLQSVNMCLVGRRRFQVVLVLFDPPGQCLTLCKVFPQGPLGFVLNQPVAADVQVNPGGIHPAGRGSEVCFTKSRDFFVVLYGSVVSLSFFLSAMFEKGGWVGLTSSTLMYPSSLPSLARTVHMGALKVRWHTLVCPILAPIGLAWQRTAYMSTTLPLHWRSVGVCFFVVVFPPRGSLRGHRPVSHGTSFLCLLPLGSSSDSCARSCVDSFFVRVWFWTVSDTCPGCGRAQEWPQDLGGGDLGGRRPTCPVSVSWVDLLGDTTGGGRRYRCRCQKIAIEGSLLPMVGYEISRMGGGGATQADADGMIRFHPSTKGRPKGNGKSHTRS